MAVLAIMELVGSVLHIEDTSSKVLRLDIQGLSLVRSYDREDAILKVQQAVTAIWPDVVIKLEIDELSPVFFGRLRGF